MLLNMTGQPPNGIGTSTGMGKPFCRNGLSLALFSSVTRIACLLGGDLWSSQLPHLQSVTIPERQRDAAVREIS